MKTLYFNGDFVPMTAEQDTFEALVVDSEGKISFTGALSEARAAAEGAREVDLEGKAMLPAFIDPHGHFGMMSNVLITADLSLCESIQEIKDTLRDFMVTHEIGPDGVVMGLGYDHTNLAEQRHLNKFDLDDVSTEVPIVIVHVSCHMMGVNGAMLDLAGITAETPDPSGAFFGRVEGTREPSGYVEETQAILPLYGVALTRVNSSFDSLIDDMQALYFSRGITTCQEGATSPEMCSQFSRLGQEGRMKIDLVMYPGEMYGVDDMLREYADLNSVEYTGHVRIGGVKIVLDGSPQGRTAWMTEPYTPGPEGEDFCAYPAKKDEEVLAFARMAVDGNYDFLAHANGDATADQILRCYTQAFEESDNPYKHELRPVMIHCQTTRRDQYEAMAKIGMIPSIFPSHIWYWGDQHLKNFGPERGMRVSAVHDALDCGLPFTFHTDPPILLPDLLEAAWCAVNRVTKKGAQLAEDQKIGVFDALKAITINGAYQYHEEDTKGTLEVGKLADLVILDKNPLKVDKMAIRDIEVLTTIKEGEVVFER